MIYFVKYKDIIISAEVLNNLITYLINSSFNTQEFEVFERITDKNVISIGWMKSGVFVRHTKLRCSCGGEYQPLKKD